MGQWWRRCCRGKNEGDIIFVFDEEELVCNCSSRVLETTNFEVRVFILESGITVRSAMGHLGEVQSQSSVKRKAIVLLV